MTTKPLTLIVRLRGTNDAGPWMLEDGAWWHDNRHLHRLFSWLTRNYMAPKFGATSIHIYQNEACSALDKIAALMRSKMPPADEYQVRVMKGLVQARLSHLDSWVTLAPVRNI